MTHAAKRTLRHAARLLAEEAESIQDGHTIGGSWDPEEAQARAVAEDFAATAAALLALTISRHSSTTSTPC